MTAVVACAVLLPILGLQFITPGSDTASQVVGLAPRRPRPVVIPPVPEYPDIPRAPLFAPDRRPGDAAPAGPQAAGASLDGYAILGAASGPSVATAVVSGPGGAAKTIRPGEILGGWRVVAIGPTKVVFEHAGARHALIVGAPAQSVSNAASGAAGQPQQEGETQ